MKRRHHFSWTSTCVLFAVLLFMATTAQAFGVGGYFHYGKADAEIEGFDDDTEKLGFGIVIDTNLAKNRLINYRLTLGYQKTEFDSGFDADGLSINNTLGFGLYKSPSMRLWFGPSIRLNVDVLDVEIIDIVDVGIGGGPELGINLHVGDHLSAGVSLSYQYMFVSRVVGEPVDTVFEGSEHLITLGITLFFRTTGDRYN